MPEEEYAKDETKELVNYLELLTNEAEEGEKSGKNGLILNEKTKYA